MIVKQMKNASFRATLDYVLGKEEAELIGSNMAGDNPRSLAKQFATYRELRPNLKRACLHATFSLAPGEDLADETFAELVDKWREGMGVENCPWLLVRHKDKEHNHCHLIASRIRNDGTVVEDSHDYHRSEVIVRQLEKTFWLQSIPCSWEVEKRAPTTRQLKHYEKSQQPSVQAQLQEIIDYHSSDRPGIPLLVARLQAEGVEVRPTISSGGLVRGIAFGLDGVTMAGNKLGKGYSLPGLAKFKGVSYEPERDDPILKRVAAGEILDVEAVEREFIRQHEASSPEPDTIGAAGEHRGEADSFSRDFGSSAGAADSPGRNSQAAARELSQPDSSSEKCADRHDSSSNNRPLETVSPGANFAGADRFDKPAINASLADSRGSNRPAVGQQSASVDASQNVSAPGQQNLQPDQQRRETSEADRGQVENPTPAAPVNGENQRQLGRQLWYSIRYLFDYARTHDLATDIPQGTEVYIKAGGYLLREIKQPDKRICFSLRSNDRGLLLQVSYGGAAQASLDAAQNMTPMDVEKLAHLEKHIRQFEQQELEQQRRLEEQRQLELQRQKQKQKSRQMEL